MELNENYIRRCNSVSHFECGDVIKKEYETRADWINANFESEPAQKHLEKLTSLTNTHARLRGEYVPWNVSGRAKYNWTKQDKNANRSMDSNNVIYVFMQKLSTFVGNRDRKYEVDTSCEDQIKGVEAVIAKGLSPKEATNDMAELYKRNPEVFYEMFEKLNTYKKIRKNSTIYKCKLLIDEGVKAVPMQVIEFEDYRLILNHAKERMFIEFFQKPQRQLIRALKSRGFYWNNRACAWSTHIDRYDSLKEWIDHMGTGVDRTPADYEKYL